MNEHLEVRHRTLHALDELHATGCIGRAEAGRRPENAGALQGVRTDRRHQLVHGVVKEERERGLRVLVDERLPHQLKDLHCRRVGGTGLRR